LPAFWTESLDVLSLISQAGLKNFNGSVNLILDVQGSPQALMVASGSVDQKNTYVFAVQPSGVAESQGQLLSYWSTGDGDDTMVTIWNPADEEQDLLFTLFFAGGHYKYAVHLGPRVTHTFNVSELMHNQIPDAEGNIIPASVHEGSAEISGPQSEMEHILMAIGIGTYNVRKATCSQHCKQCSGPIGSSLVDNPFGVASGGTHQQTYYLRNQGGGTYDVTGSSTWSTSQASVATVSGGLVSGVSPGSLTIGATSPFQSENVQDCTTLQTYPPCPTHTIAAGSPGTVQVCPNSLTVGSSRTESLVDCRRVTITRLLASKLSWLLVVRSCSPSDSIPT
jgi:hypothetical protein